MPYKLHLKTLLLAMLFSRIACFNLQLQQLSPPHALEDQATLEVATGFVARGNCTALWDEAFSEIRKVVATDVRLALRAQRCFAVVA